MTGPEFAAARKSLGFRNAETIAPLFDCSLRQWREWEKNGPTPLAARYMTALLSGWRPDDWPMKNPATD